MKKRSSSEVMRLIAASRSQLEAAYIVGNKSPGALQRRCRSEPKLRAAWLALGARGRIHGLAKCRNRSRSG